MCIRDRGWDAFGLPAENYAIKMGVHPAKSTEANIRNIKRQIKQIAAIYDWDMEVNTTDPDFYKWTQWIFVQMFKKGLAYEKEFPINSVSYTHLRWGRLLQGQFNNHPSPALTSRRLSASIRLSTLPYLRICTDS